MAVDNDRFKNEKLQKFSGEHLYYEIKMLFGVVERLKNKYEDKIIYNSLIESFVIHANIILDFFYKPAIKEDDAVAGHFIKDLNIWKQKRPCFNKYFRKFGRRRSREVVHLSYKRLDVNFEDKAWYPDKIIEPIKRLVNLFLDLSDAQKLHPKMYELYSK